jgi:hypothetical protein
MRATIAMSVAASLSCATVQPTNRGGVVMKIDGTEAHIRMSDNAVAIGDRVQFLRQRCTGGGKLTRCRDEATGDAEVVKLLNAHYSVVRVRGGVVFDDGDRVEKLGRNAPGGGDGREWFSQNEENTR